MEKNARKPMERNESLAFQPEKERRFVSN